LEDQKDFRLMPKGPSLGIQIVPGIFSVKEEKKFMRWASSLPFNIYFIPITHYNGDYSYMGKLSAGVPNSTVMPLLKAMEIFTLTGRFDYMISCSLHGGLFAYAHNTPFILYGSEKMRSFMEDRGLERHLFSNLSGMNNAFTRLLEDTPDYGGLLAKDHQALDRHVDRLKDLMLSAGNAYTDVHDDAEEQNQYVNNLRLQI